MENVIKVFSEKLKGLKKRSRNYKNEDQPMDEVFFYDPYEKKVDLNMLTDIASAAEAFKKLQRALIEASFSCNDLVKGTKDAMRHMGRCSGI